MAERANIRGTLKVLFLSEEEQEEFDATRFREPAVNKSFTFEDYADEKRNTEDVLRKALSAHWTNQNDFEVAWDENVAFTLCGGIYTPRIICWDYINTIHQVLRTTRMKDKWSYDTAVEPQPPIDGMDSMCFAIQGDTVFVDAKDLAGFDFVKYFSRSREEAAV